MATGSRQGAIVSQPDAVELSATPTLHPRGSRVSKPSTGRTRLPNGRTKIHQDERGYYTKVSLGKNPVTGVAIRKTVRGRTMSRLDDRLGQRLQQPISASTGTSADSSNDGSSTATSLSVRETP